MKKLLNYKRIFLLLLTPISLLLIFLARVSSYFSEQIYAKHLYKWISQLVSTITGLFPFSVAEFLVILLPFVILIVILRFILRMILDKRGRGEHLLRGILNVLCTASILMFLFTILGGLNYYRYPFTSYSNLEITESSVEELFGLAQSLMLEANELRAQASTTDDQGVFKLSVSDVALAKLTSEAYQLLAEDYPVLGGTFGAPKPILLSKLMSQTEITGIFIPFTMEANVNVDVPDYSIPFTMMHEQAHQRGFMREDEANFIAYLAGMKSESVDLSYSSTMQALIFAGNALYEQSPELYFKIREGYSDDVVKDIRANATYWQQYEDTVISTVSNKINDTYLKVNAQSDGVKSYGRMLDLLLAKHRSENTELGLK